MVAHEENSNSDCLVPDLAHGQKRDSLNPQTVRCLTRELAAAQAKIEHLVATNFQLRQLLAQAHKHETEALVYANKDELTGLPNRRLLRDRVQQALAHAERHKTRVAVVMIDLNGFKAINDTLGHSAGDQLLREVASRLATHIRSADTACRYGGDEFVLLLPDLDSTKAIDVVIGKIRACLTDTYLISGRSMQIGASIGYAIYPTDGREYQDLIDHADAVMYREKPPRKP